MNKKVHTIAIIAGGTPPDRFLRDIRHADLIIGADRGALWLTKHDIHPDIAIGDFDSVTMREKSQIATYAKRMLVYPPEKDATDLELAIDESVKLAPKTVVIYGAFGSRFDHSLAALHMLLKLESHNISGQIVDNFNKISIVRRQIRIKRDAKFQYVSILPIQSSATVSLRGFYYNLTCVRIESASTRGISNEIIAADASILVHNGKIVVIQSADTPMIG